MAEVTKSERRKHERLTLKGGAFATLSPHPLIAGQILNISKGGLSFRYIASKENLKDASNLSIMLTNGRFGLHDIPVAPVWDRPIPRNFSYSLIAMRHCAVKFKDLSDTQQSELKIFFENHTSSPSE